MNTQYQSDKWVKEETIKLLDKNSNRRISAMFRTLRKKNYTSLLGDYIIFAGIMYAYRGLQIKVIRKQLVYAMTFSKEFKDTERGIRIRLANQLVGLSRK